MVEERQFSASPSLPANGERVDQANGFYQRSLGMRLGIMELKVPRSHSGAFRPQVLLRYKRRDAVVDEAPRKVFVRSLHPPSRQALAGLLDEAVSAATISTVAKTLDESVAQWHRRKLSDSYRHLILDGLSARLRLVGKVERRMVLCAHDVTKEGKSRTDRFPLSQS
jgi:transposase-like protein